MRNRMQRLIAAGLVGLFLLSSLRPASADGVEYGYRDLRQPDGTIFTVRKFLDEFGRYMMVGDGYVLQDPRDGYYYYAHIAEDGTVTPSRFKVGIDDEAEGVTQVIQQSWSVVEGLAWRYHNGEEIENRIDLWSGFSGWVVVHGGEEESLLCDVLEIPSDEAALVPWFDYTPGYILIFVRLDEQTLVDKLQEAATQGETTVGVALFDSVSAVHHLEAIRKIGQNSFVLQFSEDSTLTPIAKGYCGLPYLQMVMLDAYESTGLTPVPTNLIRSSWGFLKGRFLKPGTQP